MATGRVYLGFSRSTGGFFARVIGWLIRRATGGKVNHAFFLYYSELAACWMTLGANARGVGDVPLDEFLHSRQIVDLWLPRDGSFQPAIAELHDKIGVPYNYSGLFFMAVVEIARRLGVKHPENWLSDPQAEFCSEYCAQAVARAPLGKGANALQIGIYRKHSDTIDPAMLDDMVRKSGALIWFSQTQATARVT